MENVSDKVILITGSTDGLGKLVARHLASQHATVLLHGHNHERGEKTLDQIRAITKDKKLRYYNADFASLEEVRKLAQEILSDNDRLDILINNAGIGGGPKGKSKRELSKDGYELRFAVNYLAPFLLTYNLLPLLKGSVPSRIINVSSIGQAPIDFNDVMMEKNYDSFRAYRQSKLAQIMFTIELAEELNGTGVIVNSLHPASLMNTKMVYEFFGSTMTTVEEGAEAVEYVATSDETAGVTGQYFDQKNASKANAQAYDAQARRKLMELSKKLVGLK